MDSTEILSPPTSWASAARSVVAVMTFSFLACAIVGRNRAPSSTKMSKHPKRVRFNILSFPSLKRMRAMRSEREDQLHEQLTGIDVIGIVREAVLSAQLAELAWPIGEYNGAAFIGERSIPAAVGMIKSATQEPAPR